MLNSRGRLADAAPRYLFERSIESYLSLVQANQSLVEACILYLTYSYFDPDLTDEEIDEHVLSGNYIFILLQPLNGIRCLSAVSIQENLY
jgi:hypothetical protein